MTLKLPNLARLLLKAAGSSRRLQEWMGEADAAGVNFGSYIELEYLHSHPLRNELYVFMQCHSAQELLHMVGAVEDVAA